MSGRGCWCWIVMVFVVGCARKPEQSTAELLTSAKTALNANQTEPAVTLLDQLLDRQPDHAEALLFRAQLARDAGDDALALTLVRRIPPTPGSLAGTGKYLEASLLLAQGDCREAERCCRTAIEWHPNYRQPRVALVELLLTQLRGAEAREQLQDWRKRQRWTLTQYVQHQLALSELARPADSRPTLRKFLTYQPDNRRCLLALVRDELTAGEFSQAINRLQAVLQDRADDEELQGLLTEAFVRAGTLDRAASSPGAELPSRPAPVARWRGVALLADAESNWPTAAAAWWHVVHLSPDDRHASYRLAIALERLGRTDAAQRQFQHTRQLEVMLDHVTHILAGDQRQSHLVAKMAGRIAELLLDLQRPAESQLWLEYLAETVPNSPNTKALWERLTAASRAKLSEGPETADLGPELLSAARNSSPSRAMPTQSPAAAGDAPSGSTIQLVDRQASAEISFQHFNGPTEFKYLLESLGGGVAVLDYDNDGWPDLYFPQGCRIPFDPADGEYTDRLYRNLSDGTFLDVTQAAGIVENRYSQGVAAGDFDNDGDSDLVVANYGRNTFYANNGDGTFSDISAALESDGDHWSSSAAWGDFDHDGD
ncbi:MAG: FG-GAP-like repeat-containing protein, partial [Planctomycetaceae bacterium]|nr:FG-GAP-like repeat-containing protein [Planctomycetaceae bacterium]